MKQFEDNDKKKEAVEALASYFKSINSSESHPLASWNNLERMIKTDPQLKSVTEILEKIHKSKGNGWSVIEKEGTEINNASFVDPTDEIEN